MIQSDYTIANRSGHTLIELITALVSSAVLLAGLGSVMLIARQVAFTPSAAMNRTESAEVASQIADELQFATLLTQQSPHVLEFVVADRDNDGAAERIRYAWSGDIGDPLQKTVNGGTPLTVLESVNDFSLAYQIKPQSTNLTTTVETAETVLQSNVNVQIGLERDITTAIYVAQQIHPAAFVSVPADALHWNATRLEFYGRKGGSATASLLVQLRSMAGGTGGPTSHVLGEAIVPETTLSGTGAWNAVTFPSPVRQLALHRPYAIAFAGSGGGVAARLTYSDTAASGVFESGDSGAFWQFMTTRQLFGRLYGTYTRPGTTHSITRNFVSHVRMLLQVGSHAHARIDTSVPLANLPELLSAYWRADFDRTPTAVDGDRDGTLDWTLAGGAAFDPATLINGRWHVNGALETRPLNDFNKITIVEASCRNTSVGGNGAVLRLSADRQSGLHAPLLVYLRLQPDGTQTLTLNGKSSDANTVALFTQPRLSSGLVRFQLTIVPQHNIVNLLVNDVDLGTFTYPVYAPSALDRYLTVFADTSLAEFDYVDVRVAN
jgi:hypothetical protein